MQNNNPGGDGEAMLDVRALEAELTRLPDVRSVRVVEGADGSPSEVHIIAASSKHPKQIVRDVQAVAAASFGYELDRRVVSVVRLEDAGASAKEPISPRTRLAGVTAEQRDLRTRVSVTLVRGGGEHTGSAEGSLASSARRRLAALATLDALRQLDPAASATDLESVAVVGSGERSVAVVTLELAMPSHEEILCGSAVVHDAGDVEATARAVLDAMNRRVPFMNEKVTKLATGG